MKALLERRSIRQYEDKAVPAELIEQIVEAGLHAPSSMGKQNSKIVVITNKELIHELSVVNNEIGGWLKETIPSMELPSSSWSWATPAWGNKNTTAASSWKTSCWQLIP